jgi:hypothetical protein
LVSLFENREAAQASFRQVIERNPTSSLASTSQLWLRVIEDDEQTLALKTEDFSALTGIVVHFVRESMDRQLSKRPDVQGGSRAAILQPSGEQSQMVHGLQRQVRDRDRQIAVMRAQLEALKLIDEDHAAKHRKWRAPASFNSGLSPDP